MTYAVRSSSPLPSKTRNYQTAFAKKTCYRVVACVTRLPNRTESYLIAGREQRERGRSLLGCERSKKSPQPQWKICYAPDSALASEYCDCKVFCKFCPPAMPLVSIARRHVLCRPLTGRVGGRVQHASEGRAILTTDRRDIHRGAARDECIW